jgi:hypothetical protein
MASEIAGQPHWEVSFDEHGKANQGEVDTLLAELPGRDLTDLFVFSHGWNSDRRQARRLYQLYFQQVPGMLARGGSQARVGTLGVVWPSKRWADEAEPTAAADGGGAAGLGDGLSAGGLGMSPPDPQPAPPAGDAALVEDLKDVFEGDDRAQVLDELARLLEERPDDPAALARFQTLMGELAGAEDAEAAGEDQGEQALLEDDPEEVFGRFADAVPQTGEGGAAGIGNRFGRLWNGAKEALPADLLRDEEAGRGGRQAGPGPPAGPRRPGRPRGPHPPDGAQLAARVDGPLVASFSVHDTAVGKLYPLASLSSRDDSAGLEDRLFHWGGIGHDGAQAVDATVATLGAVGTGYPFSRGRFVNLDGNAIVNRGGPPAGAHSDIFHPELVWAGLAAAGLVAPA